MNNKVRVYELAKELGTTSKTLIEVMEKLNIEVRNHMSTLEQAQAEEVIAILTGQVEGKPPREKPSGKPKSTRAKKVTKSVPATRPARSGAGRSHDRTGRAAQPYRSGQQSGRSGQTRRASYTPRRSSGRHFRGGPPPGAVPQIRAAHYDPVQPELKVGPSPLTETQTFVQPPVTAQPEKAPLSPATAIPVREAVPPEGKGHRAVPEQPAASAAPSAVATPARKISAPAAPAREVPSGRAVPPAGTAPVRRETPSRRSASPRSAPPKAAPPKGGPARETAARGKDAFRRKERFPLYPPAQRRKPGRKSRKPSREERAAAAALKERQEAIVRLEGRVTVGELASRMELSAGQVITRLLELGIMANINQELAPEAIALVAESFEVEIDYATDPLEEELLAPEEEQPVGVLQDRVPVVTVLGHVDHGKTSLLDGIRNANVTAGEFGGITQHIGAYAVEVKGKKVVFLDTPGHEAFTAMRARGAQVTDIAVLVVAADDGVMPQTIEAINHARAAEVPILVALNKMDKASANPERVKQQLSEHKLVPEEWGGETIIVPVSAMKGEGLDELLEMILLLSEMSELKASPERPARGTVIEARLDRGRGPVATVLVQDGTLRIGDAVICGTSSGKVRAMIDDRGKRLKKAGPSTPVEVLGLADVPQAGDSFMVAGDDRAARQLAERRSDRIKEATHISQRISLDDLFRQIQEEEVHELNLIVKADVHGSLEALQETLLKLSLDAVKIRIIHTGVGSITESDIMLADASNAIVIGFNVRSESGARKLAEESRVDLRFYRVIYEMIEDIEKALSGMLAPLLKEVVLGQAEVRQIFKASRIGSIAGCYVNEGKVTRNAQVRLTRDGAIQYEGRIASLKRFKDDAREVLAGYECGILLENYNDVKEGDLIEAFVMEEIQ